MKKLLPIIILLNCFCIAFSQTISFESEIKEAQTLFENGDFVSSASILESIVHNAPKNIYVLNELGVVYLKMGKYDEALNCANKVMNLDESTIKSYYVRGIAYYYLGKYEESVKDLSYFLQFYPQKTDALNSRGGAYLALEEYNLAEKDFSSAINYSLMQSWQIPPVYYANRAYTLIKKKKFPDAIKDLDICIKLNPNDSDSLVKRSYSYNQLGKYKEALADAEKALQLIPNSEEAHRNYGEVLLSSGDYENAIIEFSIVLTIVSDDALSYYLRGCAYAKLNDFQNAIKDFNKSLEITPNNEDCIQAKTLILNEIETFSKKS